MGSPFPEGNRQTLHSVAWALRDGKERRGNREGNPCCAWRSFKGDVAFEWVWRVAVCFLGREGQYSQRGQNVPSTWPRTRLGLEKQPRTHNSASQLPKLGHQLHLPGVLPDSWGSGLIGNCDLILTLRKPEAPE